MLGHDWAVELVQRLGGKVDYRGWTALIKLFRWKPEKIDFNSISFKLLWETEKNINEDELRKKMQAKLKLK